MEKKLLSDLNNNQNLTNLNKTKLVKLRKELTKDYKSYMRDLHGLSLSFDEADCYLEMIQDTESDIKKIDEMLVGL